MQNIGLWCVNRGRDERNDRCQLMRQSKKNRYMQKKRQDAEPLAITHYALPLILRVDRN
jgi:hypothetical protein